MSRLGDSMLRIRICVECFYCVVFFFFHFLGCARILHDFDWATHKSNQISETELRLLDEREGAPCVRDDKG